MCIVADKVNNVSETKIASFHVAYKLDGDTEVVPSQLVVYAANIDSQTDSNALILPVYNPGNDYKKIIPLDFSEMTNFFNDIERLYDKWFPKPMTRSLNYSTNGYYMKSNSLLEVYEVGDYKFSIMPSKIYFNKLDTKQLNVNPLAKAAIDAHSNDYSFIVYQFFKKGNIKVSPFAYLCHSHSSESMIIPTIHGHPHHSSYKLSGFEILDNYTPIENIQNSDFENEAEYDHCIYTLCKNTITKSLISKQDLSDMNKIMKQITTDYMKRNIRIYVPRSFVPNIIKIYGKKINRNILIDINKKYFVKDLVIDKGILQEIK
ncbi:hypothetical protein CE11_00830 [Megavirus courdo11]|uniref:Uncharacterized protein n=1 Tax=Megavirus courdo11 TaxID=1128140 RepID=K7Z8Q0_9VIRU|nr:hypothetical protein CE11_00830 [Megavirus courdo11]AVL94071.1 hypothetical protein mvi_711 [Megavirus vitis]